MGFIVGIVILFVVLNWIGWKWIAGVVVVIGILISLGVYVAKIRREEEYAERRAELLTKYFGDIETVDRIMSRKIWEGQTSEQLIDTLGNPVEVDKKLLKTKSKEIWKYDQTGKGRFALRVTLENNEIVGWDKKA